MKKLLEFIIESIVTDKSKVEITEIKDEENIIVFKIKLADNDKGIVIGREGRTIKSIRQILSIPARKNNQRVLIDIVD